LKIFNNINFKGGVEELGMNLSTIASKETGLEMFVDTFTEALQSACRNTFKTISKENKTKMKKSVPWWTDSLAFMHLHLFIIFHYILQIWNKSIISGSI
jgi:hypothetical protein